MFSFIQGGLHYSATTIFFIGFELIFVIFRLYYKPGTWLDGYPALIMGNGDGTVNLRSLTGCLLWQTLQKQKIYSYPLPKVDHLMILQDKTVLDHISRLVK